MNYIMKKNQIGIMSGRLSPIIDNQIQCFPLNFWQEEFEKARFLGFELIEWVFDLSVNNPIMNTSKIPEIKQLSKKYDISINSVCADYFMHKKLFDVSENDLINNLNILTKLIENCYSLEITCLELPLVDSSSMKNNNHKEQLISNLEPILIVAKNNNVFLTLETDLSPNLFKDLLLQFNHSNIMANYDIGNSTSLGHDPIVELKTLSPWIKNIHVKDRLIGGSTVPLGSGDVDFKVFFSQLADINYQGDLIIQGAREDIENPQIKPESTCKKYLQFVEQYVDKYFFTNSKWS